MTLEVNTYCVKTIEIDDSISPVFAELAKLHSEGKNGTNEQYQEAVKMVEKITGLEAYGGDPVEYGKSYIVACYEAGKETIFEL